MRYRDLDLGLISELGHLVGIPCLIVGCIGAAHGMLRLTGKVKGIHELPSTRWENAVAHVDKLNTEQ